MGAKLDSLRRLGDLEFNTPDFVSISSMSKLLEVWEMVERSWRMVSLRSDSSRQGQFKLPFHPNIPAKAAFRHARAILSDGLIVIVQKAINPADCQFGGKYYKTPQTEFLEYFEGPGTIRMMETNEVKRHVVHFDTGLRGFPPRKKVGALRKEARIIQKMRQNGEWLNEPFLVEWSIYPYPIGRLNSRMIYWELC